MDLRLDGKSVLITGASGGIGRALLDAFAAEGANLVLGAGRQLAPLEAYVAERGLESRALALAADVRAPEEVERLVASGVERFGRIDVAVACAGVWPAPAECLHEASPERIRNTVETNLMGSIWTARAFVNALRASGPRADGDGAALLFIGSTAGEFGERHHADYAASKSGLVGLVQSLKNELPLVDPYGRVNLVQPGWTVTHMVREELDQPGVVAGVVRTMPLRQLARAADIARTCLFLASPSASRHVTGETITVAGGMEGRVLWEADDVDESAVRARLDPD